MIFAKHGIDQKVRIAADFYVIVGFQEIVKIVVGFVKSSPEIGVVQL